MSCRNIAATNRCPDHSGHLFVLDDVCSREIQRLLPPCQRQHHSNDERIQTEDRNRGKNDDHDIGPEPSRDDSRRKTNGSEHNIILDEKKRQE